MVAQSTILLKYAQLCSAQSAKITKIEYESLDTAINIYEQCAQKYFLPLLYYSRNPIVIVLISLWQLQTTRVHSQPNIHSSCPCKTHPGQSSRADERIPTEECNTRRWSRIPRRL